MKISIILILKALKYIKLTWEDFVPLESNLPQGKNYSPSLKKNLKYMVQTQRLHYLSTNVLLIIEMHTVFVNQTKSILKKLMYNIFD